MKVKPGHQSGSGPVAPRPKSGSAGLAPTDQAVLRAPQLPPPGASLSHTSPLRSVVQGSLAAIARMGDLNRGSPPLAVQIRTTADRSETVPELDLRNFRRAVRGSPAAGRDLDLAVAAARAVRGASGAVEEGSLRPVAEAAGFVVTEEGGSRRMGQLLQDLDALPKGLRKLDRFKAVRRFILALT